MISLLQVEINNVLTKILLKTIVKIFSFNYYFKRYKHSGIVPTWFN